MVWGALFQMDRAGMGEPKGRKGVDEGYQEPATWPGLRRRRVLCQQHHAATRESLTLKPTTSVEEQVVVLEGRSVSEIEHLNSYFFQTAATLETARWLRICRSVFPGCLHASMCLGLLLRCLGLIDALQE